MQILEFMLSKINTTFTNLLLIQNSVTKTSGNSPKSFRLFFALL